MVIRKRDDKTIYARYMSHGLYEWTENFKDAAFFTQKDAEEFIKDCSGGMIMHLARF
jgi:hypothetical protein